MTHWFSPEEAFKPPPDWTAEQILKLRCSLRLSQPYFAALVGANVSTVRAWEGGQRRVSRPTARLLQLIAHSDDIGYELKILERAH